MGRLKVGVVGDVGIDIYTEYVAGYLSDDGSVRGARGVYDVELPAGADFANLALGTIFAKSNVDLAYFLPKLIKDKKVEPPITMHRHLVHLKRYKEKSNNGDFPARSVVRVKEAWPICDRYKMADAHIFSRLVSDKKQPEITPDEIDVLVVSDAGGRWRECPAPGSGSMRLSGFSLLEHVLTSTKKPAVPGWPKVIVDLISLPSVTREGTKVHFDPRLRVWELLARHADKVCIVCSANVFRRAGSAISRRLSWEQTVDDFARDIHLFAELEALTKFRHLIVRFGIVAALHLQHDPTRQEAPRANFVFAPVAKGGYYRDRVEDGNLLGENLMLVGALVQAISQQASRDADDQMFVEDIKSGLLGCMRAFDAGYDIDWDKSRPDAPNYRARVQKLIKNLFKNSKSAITTPYASEKGSTSKVLGHIKVPPRVFCTPTADSMHQRYDWDILRAAIHPEEFETQASPSETFKREWQRINIATAVALFGHRAVLNRDWRGREEEAKKSSGGYSIREVLLRPAYHCTAGDKPDYDVLPENELPRLPVEPQTNVTEHPSELPSIYVPIAKFGKLNIVEREEVEAVRSIHNLIRTYHEQNPIGDKSSVPISIAVFGPPGSGKSFAIKQIAEQINSTLRDPGRGLEAIEYNVAQFRSVEDLGAAIMRASNVNSEGNLPLVFFDEFDCSFRNERLAWLKYFLSPMQDGTFYGAKETIRIPRAVFVFAGGTYSTFDTFVQGRSDDDPSTRRRMFEGRKGPDFVSRLRGHINILPVNPEDQGKRRRKPFIRRAMILRSLMERRNLIKKVRDQEIGQIDEDVLFALLTVDRYRHGTRSIEAILQMCAPMEDRIEKTSLPSRAQLDMHVNAEEFLIRMYRGRARLKLLEDEPPQVSALLPNASASTSENKHEDSSAKAPLAASDLGPLAKVPTSPTHVKPDAGNE